jgi:hypothetical protein
MPLLLNIAHTLEGHVEMSVVNRGSTPQRGSLRKEAKGRILNIEY